MSTPSPEVKIHHIKKALFVPLPRQHKRRFVISLFLNDDKGFHQLIVKTIGLNHR